MTARKCIMTFLALAAVAMVGLVTTSANADVINVASVTGHDGGNWPATLGHLTDMVNGSNVGGIGTSDHNPGMDTSADPTDPATWLYSGSSWQTEWKANSRLDSITASNSKIGWAALDLGSVIGGLDKMYLWNVRFQNNTENVATYNIYYSDTPTVGLPSTPNSKQNIGDYDFSSGGWTLLNGGGALGLAQNTSNNNTPQSIVALGGISAQYIGLEILTAGNGTVAGRVGLAQVEITSAAAIPEPASLAFLGLGGVMMLVRRRRG